MEHLLAVLQQNNDLIRNWGYALLFVAAWVEGLNSMVIGGFIASLGRLSLPGVLVVMTLGHAASGYTWYMVGYFAGAKTIKRWGRHIGLGAERIKKVEDYFARYGGRAIFVTKFTVGFTIATLVTAGVLKMQLKKFSRYNLLGSAVWTLASVMFGYAFGKSFRLLGQYVHSFNRGVIFFSLFLGGAIILYYIIRRYIRILR